MKEKHKSQLPSYTCNIYFSLTHAPSLSLVHINKIPNDDTKILLVTRFQDTNLERRDTRSPLYLLTLVRVDRQPRLHKKIFDLRYLLPHANEQVEWLKSRDYATQRELQMVYVAVHILEDIDENSKYPALH